MVERVVIAASVLLARSFRALSRPELAPTRPSTMPSVSSPEPIPPKLMVPVIVESFHESVWRRARGVPVCAGTGTPPRLERLADQTQCELRR